MIKFFRRIRQNLIIENKTGKYFKYAIGEIILVVIGILIALQINNWNDKRKITDKVDSLINKTENEVIENIEYANGKIKFLRHQDSLMKRVINKQVNEKDYENFRYAGLLFNYSDYKNNTENMDKLLKLEEDVLSKYHPILEDIKFLKQRYQYTNLAWEDYQKAFTANIDYYSLNGFNHLFRRDQESIKKNVNFYLTNEDYLNRLTNYIGKNHNMLYEATINRTRLISLLGRIKIIKESFNKTQLVNLFVDLEQNHYEQIDCNTTADNYKDLVGERQRLLIFNLTSDTLKIKASDKFDNVLYELESKPGILEEHDNWRGGLLGGGDYSKVITVYKNNECIGKFTENSNGFIIIE
ncbi:hypothetical protein RM697_12695 [Ichthyenterobacterium sp. W332]|uniref:Phage abortive infection protein n=1 Tax=Microcosmobacter mediterraneus TaxID=3075607 RepID=A0ABU2YP94_9FLAO|nr:hypothetical protein [Ichthyenterobacterium sp. W332]MDT0559514.1 hypothetical protein [Ichthyenterobacterium sp. W332]